MALKDRIFKSQTGFRLLPDTEKREAFFGYFTLKDAPDVVPELTPMKYFDMREGGNEVVVGKPNAYVYIQEKANGEIVEEHRFFFSANGKKTAFEWTIEPNGKYGKNAHIITLRWGGNGEQVHRTHIWLMKTNKNKYPFIINCLGGPGKTEEQYVTVLPEGDEKEDYRIGFSDLFMEKYQPREG